MDLGNPVETIVHYLSIGGMTCLNHRNGFPMTSILVFVMHIGWDLWWIWLKVISCHDSPNCYTIWTLNFERILSLCQNQQETLTYEWDLEVIIYPYGLGHCWWRLVATGILNRDTMISHEIEIVCPIKWWKDMWSWNMWLE